MNFYCFWNICFVVFNFTNANKLCVLVFWTFKLVIRVIKDYELTAYCKRYYINYNLNCTICRFYLYFLRLLRGLASLRHNGDHCPTCGESRSRPMDLDVWDSPLEVTEKLQIKKKKLIDLTELHLNFLKKKIPTCIKGGNKHELKNVLINRNWKVDNLFSFFPLGLIFWYYLHRSASY